MTRKQKRKLRRYAKFASVIAAVFYLIGGVIAAACYVPPEDGIGRALIEEGADVEQSVIETLLLYEEPAAEVSATLDVEVLEYPFNTMSADFGGELDGFQEYSIPDEYARYGGYLPLLVQQYAWCVCQNYGMDYPVILAMIEVESAYKYDAVSSCGALGYMQIMQVWQEDRMERLGVNDLLNPYQNILVGVDLLSELVNGYGDINLALMIYNRGYRNSYGTGALDLWESGQRSTEYTRNIMSRAYEISEEIDYAKG